MIIQELQTCSTVGLAPNEIKKKIKIYGTNELKETKHFTVLKIFFSQFTDPIVIVLVCATLLSFFLKEYTDAYIIAAIIVLNALLGFFQEYRAERAIQMLSKLSSPTVKVLRGGTQHIIPAKELVPGDIILLEAGDKVCADIRIIESFMLATDESILTGESVPVNKNADIIEGTVPLGERTNMLFSGTIITTGKATGIVTETGMQTELGKIANMVQNTDEGTTPLQKKLKTLGIQLGIVILIICTIIFFVGMFRHLPWLEMLLTSISLAVSAIPEGLPAVVTITLALGVQTMYKKKVLVRKMKAIETLGSTTVICSDKTGTLTQNQMTVTDIFVNNHLIKVQDTDTDRKEMNILFEIASNCNNAVLPDIGDPTELALLDVSLHGGITGGKKKIGEIPFDSVAKFMITQHKNPAKDGAGIEYLKGSPEAVLNMCTHIRIHDKITKLTLQEKKKLIQENNKMAGKALRVLGFAYKTTTMDFVFVGLMGMIDPPREEVYEALVTCQKAGIRVIMITGDQKDTANAIAKQVGIKGEVMEGKDLEGMENRDRAIEHVNIYCRVNPEHKVKILTELQARGEIVAMTGDGVNDAPAIKKADIGVSMSRKGTDVAREAADMVLVDDNFASIVNAVYCGRIMYDNIKKFVKYMLSVNFVEIFVIMGSVFAGLPLAILPIQILRINLVTDSLPAIALGLDPGEQGVMQRKPRDKKEHILNHSIKFILIISAIEFIVLFGLFLQRHNIDLEKARTLLITTSIVFQFFVSFSVRSEKMNVWNLKMNRYLVGSIALAIVLHLILIYSPLHVWFKFVSLSGIDWLTIIGLGSVGFVLHEAQKYIRNLST